MTNKELIQKAVIKTDALAAAGKLNPEQADKFIDYVFDITTLKGKVRTVRFNPDQLDIDKIGVGTRVAMAKTEASDPGKRRGVSTSKVSLNPKEVMVPFEISDDFSEYNLEGESVDDRIIRMMATQLANDMEELCIDGDKLGPARTELDIFEGGHATDVIKDAYMALQDGWLKLAGSGNLYDANGANISSTIFSKMINSLPEKYKKNKKNLKFFCPTNIEQNYRQIIGSRATAAGDSAISSVPNLTPFGIELVPVPLISVDPRVTEHVTLNGTTAVQLKFKNLIDSAEIVTLATLDQTPTTPFIEGTDYNMNYTTGTIARDSGGAIGDGASVKITYKAEAQMLLTEYRNLIVGIGRDIRIEKDRDIFKGVNQYAISVKLAVEIENLEALVLGKNLGVN